MKTGFIAALAVSGCVIVSSCGETAEPQADAKATQAVAFVSGQSATDQLNAIRARAGQKPLVRSAALDAAARAHVADLAASGTFGHIGSNRSTPGDRVTRAGYRWCTVAENLGEGTLYNTESKIIAGWANAPDHHRNIVKPKVTAFGLAQKGGIWVQVLAGNRC